MQTTDNTIICRPCTTLELKIHTHMSQFVCMCVCVCACMHLYVTYNHTQFIPINIAELLPNVKYKYMSKHTYNAITNIRI